MVISRNSKRSLMFLLSATIATVLFSSFGSVKAAGNDIIIDVNIKGGGVGNITTSASSSQDWEFSGWTDDFCRGRGKLKCNFQKLTKKNPQRIIASFGRPKCEKISYSAWSNCSLGKKTRTAKGIFPQGCVVENPQIVESCGGLVVCQQLQEFVGPPPPEPPKVESEPGFFAKFVAAIITGARTIVEGAANLAGSAGSSLVDVVRSPVQILGQIRDYIKNENATGVADPTKEAAKEVIQGEKVVNDEVVLTKDKDGNPQVRRMVTTENIKTQDGLTTITTIVKETAVDSYNREEFLIQETITTETTYQPDPNGPKSIFLNIKTFDFDGRVSSEESTKFSSEWDKWSADMDQSNIVIKKVLVGYKREIVGYEVVAVDAPEYGTEGIKELKEVPIYKETPIYEEIIEILPETPAIKISAGLKEEVYLDIEMPSEDSFYVDPFEDSFYVDPFFDSFKLGPLPDYTDQVRECLF